MTQTMKPLLTGIRSIHKVTDAMVQAMSERFDALRPAGSNWKAPIQATIPDADFEAYNEACLWFAGCPLIRASIVDAQGNVAVTAEGYYEAVGA